MGATVEQIRYEDHLGRVHTVIKFGEIGKNANVKFHNIGSDIDLIMNIEDLRICKISKFTLEIMEGFIF